jgi:hypothetical protein
VDLGEIARVSNGSDVTVRRAEAATAIAEGAAGQLEIEVVGRRRPARLVSEPPHDPQGLRMRQ